MSFVTCYAIDSTACFGNLKILSLTYLVMSLVDLEHRTLNIRGSKLFLGQAIFDAGDGYPYGHTYNIQHGGVVLMYTIVYTYPSTLEHV